jgi:hypothetical protein
VEKRESVKERECRRAKVDVEGERKKKCSLPLLSPFQVNLKSPHPALGRRFNMEKKVLAGLQGERGRRGARVCREERTQTR